MYDATYFVQSWRHMISTSTIPYTYEKYFKKNMSKVLRNLNLYYKPL